LFFARFAVRISILSVINISISGFGGHIDFLLYVGATFIGETSFEPTVVEKFAFTAKITITDTLV